MTYDAIIIGGGAAGLFCAITAGKRGKRVVVLERNAEVGRKIIISGGGRCNFTNTDVSAENFISQNPHFAKSALAGFTPQDFIELVKKHKIPFYEKKLGQLFCRESSRAIVAMLLDECKKARVEIRTSCNIKKVLNGVHFDAEIDGGVLQSKALVVACGGLSFPKVGATSFGYDLARQFGLKIVAMRPSLVAMVAEGEPHKDLAGISVDSEVSSGKKRFRENILFTHRGLSGPAILQISNYWKKGIAVEIDLLPDVTDTIASDRKAITKHLPQRLVDNLSSIDDLKHWAVKFSRTEGYDRAEVTLGGVSTDELSSKTMQSKKVAGLYFIGEVVDVTGWLGGYNFQWAWASGFAAGNSI